MSTSANAELIRQLERARALHEERAASDELAAALDRLALWQSRRLDATYADLARQSRYARAIAFFGTDLYGPGDFSRRDADLARVVPHMTLVLPERVIATIAGAMELSVLSQELDRALLRKLRPSAKLSVATYCAAYRALDNRHARERQIGLIVELGSALDRYVASPFVRSALVAMRYPARLAGLGELQDLLERGFGAFWEMHGADEFLATVKERETALMEKILAGEPDPFAEPDDTLA